MHMLLNVTIFALITNKSTIGNEYFGCFTAKIILIFITVVFHFKAAFLMTRSLKTGLKLENFRLSSDDIAKKHYF